MMPAHAQEPAPDGVTAAEDLFVVSHFGVPRIDPRHWLLSIGGLVGRDRSFSLEDLKARPKRVVEAVHQGSGDALEADAPTRRVANVRWGGVDLAALLDELEVDPRASFLWSYGVDGGDFAGASCNWYLKDLPLERLAGGGVLLAYELNGAPLRAEHGFPVRLVVPGYYGANSVKWLWRLHLSERRAKGPFATTFHSGVRAIAPESIIVNPAPDAVLAAGEAVEIRGWAWSSRGVASAEISVDNGLRFTPAALEPRRGWGWQRFSLPWLPTVRGEAHLRVRAHDADCASQPLDGARNSVHALRVFIGS
jgi:DMSO/TMAO reductase YedYZ molybdopterin-dependent catalytic subunit